MITWARKPQQRLPGIARIAQKFATWNGARPDSVCDVPPEGWNTHQFTEGRAPGNGTRGDSDGLLRGGRVLLRVVHGAIAWMHSLLDMLVLGSRQESQGYAI